MIESLLGTIRGNTIELQTPSGFAEGMLVEVVVRTVKSQEDLESIRRGIKDLEEGNTTDLESAMSRIRQKLNLA